MAAKNTVEATLLSKFEDGVSKGIAHTEQVLASAFNSMKSAGAAFSGAFNGVWGSVVGGLESWQQRLRHASQESDSQWGKMGLAAVAFSVVVVAAVLKAGKAIADFVFGLMKESSQALEARVAFESLTAAMDIQGDLLLGKLKRATEGQVSGTVLLQNANRILQSGVPITTEVLARLTENVFRLADASGADGAQGGRHSY